MCVRLLIFLCCFLAIPAFASILGLSSYPNVGPLGTRTQSPMYLLFISETMQKAALDEEAGHYGVSLEVALSNVIDVMQDKQNSVVDLDFEVYRSALNAEYGLSQTNNVGIEVPFLSFSGGLFDAAIQGYHQFFGFPNGQRAAFSNYRLAYRVNYLGNEIYEPKPSAFALGDIIVWSKWNFLAEGEFAPAMSVKGSIKIPSGSPDRATGSGRFDFGASLFVEKTLWQRLHSYTLAGVALNTGMTALDPVLVPAQFSFGQAFEFNVLEHLSLVTQVTGSTALFSRTQVDGLNNPVLDLTAGVVGNFDMGATLQKIHYEIGLTEDLLAEPPSVDVSLFFKMGFLF